MQLTITGADAIIAGCDKIPSSTTRALVRAMNRAMASARTVMVREIARDTGLKSKDVRDAMPFRKATSDRPQARLAAGLKRIPLYKFNARGPYPSRGRGRGVTYRLASGGRGRHPNAFIAKMTSMGVIKSTEHATLSPGHMGVFVRRTKTRLPIAELFGPSLGHVFRKFRPQGQAKLQEAFEKNFRHEFDRAQQEAFENLLVRAENDAGTD